jgi:hypothetical protein
MSARLYDRRNQVKITSPAGRCLMMKTPGIINNIVSACFQPQVINGFIDVIDLVVSGRRKLVGPFNGDAREIDRVDFAISISEISRVLATAVSSDGGRYEFTAFRLGRLGFVCNQFSYGVVCRLCVPNPIVWDIACSVAECLLMARMRSTRYPLFGRCEGKSGRREHRAGPRLEVQGTAEKLAESPQVLRSCCVQHCVPARNSLAMLLRQKFICDNQSHHARKNQECREGFPDHWSRTARNR